MPPLTFSRSNVCIKWLHEKGQLLHGALSWKCNFYRAGFIKILKVEPGKGDERGGGLQDVNRGGGKKINMRGAHLLHPNCHVSLPDMISAVIFVTFFVSPFLLHPSSAISVQPHFAFHHEVRSCGCGRPKSKRCMCDRKLPLTLKRKHDNGEAWN